MLSCAWQVEPGREHPLLVIAGKRGFVVQMRPGLVKKIKVSDRPKCLSTNNAHTDDISHFPRARHCCQRRAYGSLPVKTLGGGLVGQPKTRVRIPQAVHPGPDSHSAGSSPIGPGGLGPASAGGGRADPTRSCMWKDRCRRDVRGNQSSHGPPTGPGPGGLGWKSREQVGLLCPVALPIFKDICLQRNPSGSWG